jgi:hypothetical protein
VQKLSGKVAEMESRVAQVESGIEEMTSGKFTPAIIGTVKVIS